MYLVALLVVFGLAATAVRGGGSYTAGHGESLPTNSLLWPNITGPYLRDCMTGGVDPQPLRAALLRCLNHWAFCPPIKGDPLVITAGSPRGFVIQEQSLGFPLTWYFERRQTGYDDIFNETGPRRDLWWLSYPTDPYLNRWTNSLRSFCISWRSIENGATELDQSVDYLNLALYLILAVAALQRFARAAGRGSFWPAALHATLLAAMIAAAARPDGRVDRYPSDNNSLIPTVAHQLTRSRVAELVKTDEGVREIATQIYENPTGTIEDGWLVGGGFDTETPAVRQGQLWTRPLLFLDTNVIIANAPETSEWNAGLDASWRYNGLHLMRETVGRKDIITIYPRPIAALVVLAVVLANTLIRTQRRWIRWRERKRSVAGLCLACAYPVPVLRTTA